MSASLDKLVREAREELGTREAKGVNWDAVDRSLFARIERERRAERARFFAPRSGRVWASLAAGLAVATGVAVFAGKARELPSPPVVSTEESAGTLVSVDGKTGEPGATPDDRYAQVLINGRPAARGALLRLGDVVETRSAQATIERAGKLSLILDRGTRVSVTHVQGALVLALAQGAVEAQIVPIPRGEAFAVDVESARVAVHGTHVRVARSDERVVVDLNEGVVSLGEAPRVGSVLGALVTAPAHAEFAAADTLGTLTVTHDPSEVRVPVALGAAERARSAFVAAPPLAPPKTESARVGPALSGVARPEMHSTALAAATPNSALANPNAEVALANAVRACMAERPRAENVTVVVSTTLHLELADDGTVRTARFDPPVAPDVNGCAAQSIYKTRFAHGGSVALPIALTVPE